MTGLGIIGTAAAYANYRSAKAEYEALKEQQDGLIAAVQTYNSSKRDELYARETAEPDNAIPSEMKTTTILRVGNLVGSHFRYEASVVFSNISSSKTYHIKHVGVKCEVLGMVTDDAPIACDKTIAPGETAEIILPKKLSKGTGDFMSKLRDLICKAAGKRLITSCPKLNIENVEKANIEVTYTEDGENQAKTYFYNEKPGVLRYCGEAYL